MTYSLASDEDLIRACAESNDGGAWQEFVFRFHKPISLSILRTANKWGGLSHELIDDLVQETYLKLCADRCYLLCVFAAKHPDATTNYIRTIAVNVVHDYFKGLHSHKRGSGRPVGNLELSEPSAPLECSGSPGGMEREVLLSQISRCMDTCAIGPDKERDKMIFWLYYRQGLTAQSIAALPTIRLTSKGVESVISRLTRLVRAELTRTNKAESTERPANEKGFQAAESY
jgi:RNA polymerase sigma-70 factor (ECF subfamily)